MFQDGSLIWKQFYGHFSRIQRQLPKKYQNEVQIVSWNTCDERVTAGRSKLRVCLSRIGIKTWKLEFKSNASQFKPFELWY